MRLSLKEALDLILVVTTPRMNLKYYKNYNDKFNNLKINKIRVILKLIIKYFDVLAYKILSMNPFRMVKIY